MRILQTLVIVGAVLAPFALLGDVDDVERTVYVSLVEKDQVLSFYNRLATPEGQVVATEKMPAAAHRSVAVEQKEGHRLYLVPAWIRRPLTRTLCTMRSAQSLNSWKRW